MGKPHVDNSPTMTMSTVASCREQDSGTGGPRFDIYLRHEVYLSKTLYDFRMMVYVLIITQELGSLHHPDMAEKLLTETL